MNTDYVINQIELADRLDHDFELFVELSDLFFDDSKSLLDKIKSSIDNKDPEGLRKSAHTLKGAVSNFSATSAYDAAYDLEMAGKDCKIEDADDLYKKLDHAITRVIEEMKAMVKKGSF